MDPKIHFTLHVLDTKLEAYFSIHWFVSMLKYWFILYSMYTFPNKEKIDIAREIES